MVSLGARRREEFLSFFFLIHMVLYVGFFNPLPVEF